MSLDHMIVNSDILSMINSYLGSGLNSAAPAQATPQTSNILQQAPMRLGEIALDPMSLLIGLAGLALMLLVILIIIILRQNGEKSVHSTAFDAEMAELKGRMQTLAEITVTRQSEVSRGLHERLDGVGHRLGQGMHESTKRTNESLSQLQQRLAVIDNAQRNITELSNQMVSLQEILANKQSRGAFGQGRMEAIIKDGLPRNAYTFQATLSNNTRPDCLVHLPDNPASIVIDAKFPLEALELFRAARTEAEQKEAVRQVRQDVGRHIDEIAAKYFITGETQDTGLMFIPSEALYADLHEFFPDIIQKAYRARIVLASPNMLMLAVQTMQAIMKDVKMREAASIIQKEVSVLMDDVNRLRDRTLNLQKHFGQANKDIEQILTSSDKISSRGRKIESLDFDHEAEKAIEAKEKTKSARKDKNSPPPPPPSQRLAGE